MLVAVAAVKARWHSITNSVQRASPARAFSKTSSGSRSRKRKRMERRPRIPSRCPRPPQPQKFSLESSVTTECPPSQIPSFEGIWEGGHSVVTLDSKENFCGCGGRGHLEGILGRRSMRLRFLDLEPDEVF